jgi:hypothetical protein
MKKIYLSCILAVSFFAMNGQNQQIVVGSEEYQNLKASGYFTGKDTHELFKISDVVNNHQNNDAIAKSEEDDTLAVCDCWIEPDETYSLAMEPNDDFSSGLINLPFSFCFYGDSYDSLYINNNGNVSFDYPYSTFTSDQFPSTYYKMVAAFWADVDTRGDDGFGLNGGQVLYKLTEHALYVNWVDVGYFSQQTDKTCSFQLIISDGTDESIEEGNNVKFCYKDMSWTTGYASGGIDGFGGTPANIGANRGDGISYFQIGRFDTTGVWYDGSYGESDGMDYMDYRSIVANTCSSENIPPLTVANNCDTTQLFLGEIITYDIWFLGPEIDQEVSIEVLSDIEGLTILSNESGISAKISVQFEATALNSGNNLLQFKATDNAAIPGITYYSPLVDVLGASGLDVNGNATMLSIFPNPSQDGKINIVYPFVSSKQFVISVTDMTGREVYNDLVSNSNQPNHSVDLRKLDKGIYNVSISDNNLKSVKKVILN